MIEGSWVKLWTGLPADLTTIAELNRQKDLLVEMMLLTSNLVDTAEQEYSKHFGAVDGFPEKFQTEKNVATPKVKT